MAAGTPTQGVNWSFVGLGTLLLVLAVFGIDDALLRALVAAAVMLLTFYWSQPRQESEVESPVFEKLHEGRAGLDRRKYGRLRASTEGLLDFVREMNRIAIEGREGKLSQRHVQAEMDRLAASMRELIEDVRKSAGVPTPPESAKAPRPQVVIPKAQPPAQPPHGGRPGGPGGTGGTRGTGGTGGTGGTSGGGGGGPGPAQR